MVGPISYSLEVMYTLSRTMPQTDEGYNMLPIPTLSIFRVIWLLEKQFRACQLLFLEEEEAALSIFKLLKIAVFAVELSQ